MRMLVLHECWETSLGGIAQETRDLPSLLRLSEKIRTKKRLSRALDNLCVCTPTASTERNTQAKEEYDKTIQDTEAAYMKVTSYFPTS